MVKIRLRRIGSKGRPYYRMVVAPSTAARNGRFVETIGSYDPVAQPKKYEVDEERALHWLMNGAQPTETAAVILSRTGVLQKYLEQRPERRKEFSFLDKRTAAISKQSAVTVAPAPAGAETPQAEALPAEEPAAVPVSEAPVETQDAVVETAEEIVETPETTVEAPAEEEGS